MIDKEVAAAGPHAWMLYSVGDDGRDDGGVVAGHAPVGDRLVHLPGEPVPEQPDAEGVPKWKLNILGHDPNY